MACGTGRVIRVEHGLNGSLAYKRTSNAGGNPFAGHVGQFLIHELRRVGAPFADQATIQPLFGDPLELAEEMEFGLLAGVTPFGVEQRSEEHTSELQSR